MNFRLAAQKSDYTSKILSLSVSHLFFLTNLECLSSLLPSTSLRKCELFQKLSQPCFSLTPSILWLPSIHSEWILHAPTLRTTSPPYLYVCIYISNFKVNTLKTRLLTPEYYLISGSGSSSLTLPRDKALGSLFLSHLTSFA